MTKAVRKEGLRAPLFYAVAVTLLIPAVLPAQEVSGSDLETCAGLETAELKLACFEALTERYRAGTAAVSPVPAAPDKSAAEVATAQEDDGLVETAAAGAAATAAAVETAPAANAEPDEPVVEAESAPPVPQPEDTAAAEPAAAVAAAVVPDDSLPDEAGERYLPDEDGEEDVFVATVTDVTESRSRTLYFYLANGQVWRQMEPRRMPYPRNREFEVEITRGAMGEYQLRVEGEGRMTRIVRMK